MKSSWFRLYLRFLGLTALIAVTDFWFQMGGLCGSNGIVSSTAWILNLKSSGVYSIFDVPSIIWLFPNDLTMHLACAFASLSSLALLLNFYSKISSFILCISWLSLVSVCHPFLDFQWDILLVEVAFVTFLATPHVRRITTDDSLSSWGQWVFILLCAKVSFESGFVKIMSGDEAWRNLTALSFHWWSQPLPTFTSYWFAALPLFAQKALCALTLTIELVAPLVLFIPPVRPFAAWALVLLQAALFSAGNYSYYNVLTAILSIPLLILLPSTSKRNNWHWVLVIGYCFISLTSFSHVTIPIQMIQSAFDRIARFHFVNGYGAFAVMTKTRGEISIEASIDGISWTPYVFKYKPGPLNRRPVFVAPWQPRLDWQMWFAALGDCRSNQWLFSLQEQLLKQNNVVVDLFEMPLKTSARILRTTIVEYRFSEEKDEWWKVEGTPRSYCPAVTLDENRQLVLFR
jgi:lipase maturation factor 1